MSLPAILRRPLRPVFLLCDVQERFRPLIHGFQAVVHSSATLLKVARALSLPVLATEQYPKALGATCAELLPLLPSPAIAKMQFAMTVPELDSALPADYDSAVLFGIETHVCIQQTALELLRRGKQVLVPVDACSSQRVGDRSAALRLLAAAGANVTSVESAIFTIVGSADHPRFKDVSKIVKEHFARAKEDSVLGGLDNVQ
jgi:nicotinamidase-related amidase